MLEHFFAWFQEDEHLDSEEDTLPEDLRRNFGGRTFGDGALQILKPGDEKDYAAWIRWLRPQEKIVWPFAASWDGDIFFLDQQEKVNIMDPSEYRCYQTDLSLRQFLDEEIPGQPEAALDITAYRTWRKRTLGKVKYGRCLGRIIPMEDGGPALISNLELQNLHDYWQKRINRLKDLERQRS